jgi:hypothetical protein
MVTLHFFWQGSWNVYLIMLSPYSVNHLCLQYLASTMACVYSAYQECKPPTFIVMCVYSVENPNFYKMVEKKSKERKHNSQKNTRTKAFPSYVAYVSFYCGENLFLLCVCKVSSWFMVVKQKLETKRTCNPLPHGHCIDNVDWIDKTWIH